MQEYRIIHLNTNAKPTPYIVIEDYNYTYLEYAR